MANQYDTNLKLQAIADAIGDSQSSGLISALEDISDAIAGGGGGGSSAAGLVSDAFSESRTYDIGEYCIYNNTLYKCINAISIPGSWDLSDWEATNAGEEIAQVYSDLTAKTGFIDVASGSLYQITTAGASWTATQDCWCVARARKNNTSASVNPQVYLYSAPSGSSITMMNVTGVDYAFAIFPVKKGQVVATRNGSDMTYQADFYGFL